MRSSSTLKLVKSTACVILAFALLGSAYASCGDSLNAMAVKAAAIRGTQSTSGQAASTAASANANNPSIVGLWHIRFVVGDQTIQEAFQIWNQGGTEVHNPNVDPRGGSVCLGAWREAPQQTFKLTHRVWLYDINGNLQAVGHLSETVTLGDNGNSQTGTFTLSFYDPAGNFQFSVPGNVVAERISPE